MSDAATPTIEPWGRFDAFRAWLQGCERAVLIAAVGFQVLVLVAMIGLRATPLLTGDTLLVRVVPVDPRDLFRGDYVILSYDFSRLPPTIDGLPGTFSRNERDWMGRTVYVTLVPEPDGKHWRAETVSTRQPAGGRFLRGRIVGPGRLEFGIESYFVQEGQGRRYEQAVRDRSLTAEIAVTADGQAALRGLRIE
ncbi:MAG: GDYXXLXY domain-containing protein [Gemmataceae bacterium]